MLFSHIGAYFSITSQQLTIVVEVGFPHACMRSQDLQVQGGTLNAVG